MDWLTLVDPRYPMSARERVRRVYDEKMLMPLAHRLPRRLVMWCAVRVINEACSGEYASQVVPDLAALDALERWGVQ